MSWSYRARIILLLASWMSVHFWQCSLGFVFGSISSYDFALENLRFGRFIETIASDSLTVSARFVKLLLKFGHSWGTTPPETSINKHDHIIQHHSQ